MMKMTLSFAIIVFALLESGDAGFLPRLANDPNYGQVSPRRSFYVISVDSGEWRRFGLAGAPVVEPSRFNQGEGVDVLAIPFDASGRVAFAPIYIYTIRPEQYQVQRMCALVQGYTSKADAELLMGSTPLKRRIRGYDVWFFEFRVRNPFEENPFDFRH
jgi:hypothetical protein